MSLPGSEPDRTTTPEAEENANSSESSDESGGSEFDFRATLKYWKVFERKRRNLGMMPELLGHFFKNKNAVDGDVLARGDSPKIADQSAPVVPTTSASGRTEEEYQFIWFVWIPLTTMVLLYLLVILYSDRLLPDLYEKDCDCVDLFKFLRVHQVQGKVDF